VRFVINGIEYEMELLTTTLKIDEALLHYLPLFIERITILDLLQSLNF
jgi:hypothetical protein